MSRIRFEDLPSTNTPITAENLDKLNNVVISPTEPTTGEEVWIKKGKNKFNANELFLDQTNHVTNNNSTNKLSITTNGNYGYSRYKLTIPNEYLNKEVSISFNGVSTINKSQNNIRNTIYISSTPNESGDIMTQLLTTTKTKYSIKFTPNSQEIYITLYGTLSDYSTIMTIEMSEIQLELGETTDYEPYVEQEIYVKNENGVFERFYKEPFESGQNENGNYIKYSNGICIQYGTKIQSTGDTSYNSGGFTHYISQVTYDFPVAFKDSYQIFANINSANLVHVCLVYAETNNDRSKFNLNFMSSIANYSRTIHWFAIGRWK